MSPKPTFLLLAESYSIPVDMGPRILGALCERMEDPLSCWKPDDASKVFSAKFPADDLSHRPAINTMHTAEVEINRQKYKQFGGVLEGLLRAMWSKTTDDDYRIDSQLIRTVRLPQHRDMFKALLDDKGVQEFREARQDDRYFLITGYKSCVNGLITRKRSQSSGPDLEVDVPLELLLNSLVPIPPGLLPQIGATGTWTTSADNLSKYLLRGEYIFAIEYKEVLRKSRIAGILKRRKDERKEVADRVYGQPRWDGVYGPGEGAENAHLDLPIPTAKEYSQKSVKIDEEDDPHMLGLEVDPTAEALAKGQWNFIE